ncbi:HNH endonuclease [Sporosarcina ureilytica]|nr:HNH endonuclease [Sporosarcina ureilytica]
MKSFLVMQGHTYNEEKELGFIWAAKKDRSGMPSHSWQRLTEVKKGDLVFHYVNGRILAVSVAKESCKIADRPSIDEHVEQQDEKGYYVELEYHELNVPIHIQSNFDAIRPLLPIRYSPFQLNGHGNQGYLYPCNEKLSVKLLGIIADANITEVEDEQLEFAMSPVVPVERDMLLPLLHTAESRMRTKIRKSQQSFCKDLMLLWAYQCVLCGIDLPELLKAVRSKPWKDSSDVERVDPYNGLLLCANHAALYENGLIAFDGQGRLHISSQLSEEDYEKYDLHKKVKIARQENHKKYLKWHKRHLFRS